MRDDDKKGANVIHVKVTVTQSGSSFNPVYAPPVIPVKHNNAVLRFRLDSDTPSNIVIDTVTVPASAKDQLGTPEISQNGKQVDITDKNTAKGIIHLTFTFKNEPGSSAPLKANHSSRSDEFPQIDNDPPGYAAMKCADSEADEFPQIDNDPPG